MKTGLQIKAQLENLFSFKSEGDDFRWYLKLTCTSCGEETPDFVYCSLCESAPKAGGKGQASLVLKCKLCKRENSIDIIKDKLEAYRVNQEGQFQTIAVFDCRGVTPSEFSPRMGWEAHCSESSTVFTDVDLSENEWYEYDEQGKQSVSITELTYKFVSL